MNATANPVQIRLARRSPAYWRVTIGNPPINVMGPEMVQQFQEVINALEADEHVQGRGFRQRSGRVLPESLRFLGQTREPDRSAGRPYRLAALAGLPRAPDSRACCLDRPHPRACDGERQRAHARLRYEFRQSRKGHPLAMGGGCGDGRRWRPDGPATPAHWSKPCAGGALELGRHQRRPS